MPRRRVLCIPPHTSKESVILSCSHLVCRRGLRLKRRAPGRKGPATGCRKTSGDSGAVAQFAMVALRRPVGPSWRSLAHWASASLHLPLAALGSRSLQWSRWVGPWGHPGASLLIGLPPRFICHWQPSALPPGCFHRIWRHKVNCPEGTREDPLGGMGKIRKKPCVARVSLHGSLAAPLAQGSHKNLEKVAPATFLTS